MYIGENVLSFQEIDITEKPPALSVLRGWVKSGALELKQLLNTSGVEYRAQNIKEKLKTESPDAILKLLAANGRLFKRPIITDGKSVTVGFRDPDAVTALWSR